MLGVKKKIKKNSILMSLKAIEDTIIWIPDIKGVL